MFSCSEVMRTKGIMGVATSHASSCWEFCRESWSLKKKRKKENVSLAVVEIKSHMYRGRREREREICFCLSPLELCSPLGYLWFTSLWGPAAFLWIPEDTSYLFFLSKFDWIGFYFLKSTEPWLRKFPYLITAKHLQEGTSPSFLLYR